MLRAHTRTGPRWPGIDQLCSTHSESPAPERGGQAKGPENKAELSTFTQTRPLTVCTGLSACIPLLRQIKSLSVSHTEGHIPVFAKATPAYYIHSFLFFLLCHPQ